MPELNSQITVSAILITHNSAENLSSCLTSLSDEFQSLPGEIILFDNNSSDNTIELTKSNFPDVKIIPSSHNLGFARAANNAARKAAGKYLLFANPDMIIDSGAIGLLIKTMLDHSDAGAVVPRMRNPDGSFQPTCRQFPNPRNMLFSRGSVFRSKAEPKLLKKSHSSYTLPDYENLTAVPAAAATCMLLEKNFFDHLGGFDGRFFMFMEDTDLCLRIKRAEKKVYFTPAAGAVHLWGKGSTAPRWKRSRYHHISVWKYFMKHSPGVFSLLVLPPALLVNFCLTNIIGSKRS